MILIIVIAMFKMMIIYFIAITQFCDAVRPNEWNTLLQDNQTSLWKRTLCKFKSSSSITGKEHANFMKTTSDVIRFDPQNLANYTKPAILKQGSTGEFILAIYQQKEVIVKVIEKVKKNGEKKTESIVDPQMILCEIDIMKIMTSQTPCVVPKFIDAFQDTEFIFISMEYVKGVTLEDFHQHQLSHDRLQNMTSSSPVFREKYARLITALLLKNRFNMRNAKVLHRNLNRSNIILTENLIKFVDFGISQKADADKHDVIMGTVGIMPPEMFGENPYYDSNSEYWSMMMNIYWFLTNSDIIDYNNESKARTEMQSYIQNPKSFEEKIIANLSKAHVSKQGISFITGSLQIDATKRSSFKEPEKLQADPWFDEFEHNNYTFSKIDFEKLHEKVEPWEGAMIPIVTKSDFRVINNTI